MGRCDAGLGCQLLALPARLLLQHRRRAAERETGAERECERQRQIQSLRQRALAYRMRAVRLLNHVTVVTSRKYLDLVTRINLGRVPLSKTTS